MGLVKIWSENNCQFGLWKTVETIEELEAILPSYYIKNVSNEKRKKEILVVRILLQQMIPKAILTYDLNGAPKINSNKQISISHSHGWVAIGISEKRIGLDLEKISGKALRIAQKFSLDYFSSADIATLHWCCKEAIYKWHQLGNIDFKDDIHILPFALATEGKIQATFRKSKIVLYYKRINSFFLVYVCN